MIEIIASVLWLIQWVLIMMNKRSNRIFYILQMIFLVIFSYFAKLYWDMGLDLLYIWFGIIWYISRWKKESKIEKLSNKNLLLTVWIGMIASFIVYFILKASNDVLPVMDSITTVISIIATVLMVRRKLESWIFWLIWDILYCVQYLLLPDMALYLFILNLIWTALAVATYIQWYRELKQYDCNVAFSL